MKILHFATMQDIQKNLDMNGIKIFKYEIKIKNQKIIKKLTLEKQKTIDFNVDENRIFNLAVHFLID